MEAYCVKCKTKREMADPQAVFTATGAPATKGRCSVCGTNLYRMGETEAHAGLPHPERTARRQAHVAGAADEDGGFDGFDQARTARPQPRQRALRPTRRTRPAESRPRTFAHSSGLSE